MKKTLLYSLVFLSAFSISATSLTAQKCDSPWSFGALYNLVIPTGKLEANGLGYLHGANFEFFYLGVTSDRNLKFQPGLIISGGVSKSIENSITLAEPLGAAGRANTYNSIADFRLGLKFIPFDSGRLKPYTQFAGGIRFSGVQERISTADNFSDFQDDTEQQNGNWSTVYGGSLGLLIGITKNIELDFRTNYERTGQIEHIDINSTAVGNFIENNSVQNYGINLGVRIRFGCKNGQHSETYDRHRDSKIMKKRKVKKKQTEQKNTSISS